MYKIYVKGLRKSNNIFKHKKFNDNYIKQSSKSYEKLKTRDKDNFEYIYYHWVQYIRVKQT